MSKLTKDPPVDPRLMGWGDATLQAHHNLALEARSIEYLNSNTGVICTAKQATGAGAMNAKIEKLIRSRFQFDSGWDCMVAERIVYRLTPEQTLMVNQNMGNCFKPGVLIRLADGSQKPIESMRLRDVVVTAEGRTGMVRKLMTRDVSKDDPLVRLKLWGHFGLSLTSEHPILTKRGYVEAGNIVVGDEVAITRYLPSTKSSVVVVSQHATQRKQSEYGKRRSVSSAGGGRKTIAVQHAMPDVISLDSDFGLLAGMFLAEGSTEYGKVKWSFCSDEENTLVAKTIELVEKIFGVTPSKRFMNRNSVCQVILHSTVAAQLFASLFGKLPTGKEIHADLASAPDEFLEAMIAGWLDGDGHQDGSEMLGTTVSKKLAVGMFCIAHGLGHSVMIRRTYPRISHGVKSRQTRYDVVFSLRKTKSTKITSEATHSWHSVRSIESEPYNGPVYNFSVEGDESYVADGVAVHNCVGNSHGCLLSSRIAHEILAIGDAEEPLGMQQLSIPFIPYTYGVGRMAGGMLNSRGDGSYCGAQIEGTMEYGFLPCFIEGLSSYGGTLPQSSASVGRLFGSSKREIDKWLPKAQTFKLDEAPVAKSADDAIKLIEEKQVPLQICSGTMPAFWKVDSELGIPLYRMGTPASHSTQIVSSFTLKGRKFVVGRNQWGYDAHRGAPTMGIPRGCYVFPIEELAKWLPRAECIGLGSITGLQQAPVFA